MKGRSLSVWEKIDVEEYKQLRLTLMSEVSSGVVVKPEPSRWSKLRKRSFWTMLDAIASLIWIYALLKLFVSDFDRWIVSQVSPTLLWIIDFRFFVWLSLVTILVLVTKHWKSAGILLYIGFFPLVVAFWKIPRLYYRAQSWNFFIGSVQVLWSLGKSIKFALFAVTTFALATLSIVQDGPNWVLWGAIAALLLLWGALLGRAIIYALRPSNFVLYQQEALGKVFASERTWNFVSLPSEAKCAVVTRLNKSQVDSLVTQATFGLMLFSMSAHWAEKLDQYRQSGMSVVFSAFSVVALLGQAVVIFALANIGIYRIDETQFAFSEAPSLSTFVRYSLSSMFPGEIEALRPAGQAANWLSILEGFSCAVIVLVLVVSLYFSFKQAQEDRVAAMSIQRMRSTADAFADKLAGEYRVPLLDLYSRVTELGGLITDRVREVTYSAILLHQRAKKKEDWS